MLKQIDTPTASLTYFETQLPLLKEHIERFETLSDRLRSTADFDSLKATLALAMQTLNETFNVFLQGQQTIPTKDWQDIVSSFDHLNRYFQDVLLYAKQGIDHLLTQASDAGVGQLIWGELIAQIGKNQKELTHKQMHIPYQYLISRQNAGYFLRHLDQHLKTETLSQMHREQSTHPLFSQFAEQFAASIANGDIRFGLDKLRARIENEHDPDELRQINARIMNEYYSTLLGLKLRLQPYVDQFNIATAQIFAAISDLEATMHELQSLGESKIAASKISVTDRPVNTAQTEEDDLLSSKTHRLTLEVSAHRQAIANFAEAQTMSKGGADSKGMLKRLFDLLRGRRQKPVLKTSPYSLVNLQSTQSELKGRLAALHEQIDQQGESPLRQQSETIFSDLLMMEEMIQHLTPKAQKSTLQKPTASYRLDRARRVSADLLISTGPKQATFQFNLPEGANIHTVPPMVRKHLQQLMRDDAPARLFISGKDAHLVGLTKQFAQSLHASMNNTAAPQQFDPHLSQAFTQECQEAHVAAPAA